MPTYTVEDTVGFDITVAPATQAAIVSPSGLTASVTFPGPQGPKGDTGPAGPAATDTAQTWTQRQTFQRNADDTPVVIQSNVTQTADLTQWKNNAGVNVARMAPDGTISFNDVGGAFIRGNGNNDYTVRVGHHVAIPGGLYVSGFAPDGTIALGVSSPAASSVGLVVSGVASQTGDLQRWTDSAGAVHARITSAGHYLTNNVRIQANEITIGGIGGRIGVSTLNATTVGTIVQGVASQSADLSQWINDAGTVLARITAAGQFQSHGINNLGVLDSNSAFRGPYLHDRTNSRPYISIEGGGLADAAGSIGVVIRSPAHTGWVVRGAGSQTGDLQQWQNSAGTLLARVSWEGAIESAYIRHSQVAYQLLSKGDARSMWSSPYGFRTWADKLRFRRPSVVEISAATDNTGWTTTGAPTIDQTVAVLDGRTDTMLTVSTPTAPATRITWNSTGNGYGNIQHLLFGFTYNNPSWEARIIWESSADGITWTVRRDASIGNPTAAWKGLLADDHGADAYFRLSIIGTPGTQTTGSLILASFQALSGRPGNQGGGFQDEFPFYWNSTKAVVFQPGVTGATPIIARGLGGQTAPLQRWEDSAGTALAHINSNGQVYSPSVFAGGQNFGANLSVSTGVAAGVGAIVRGVASQTGDLTQWQNSAGTVLSKVLSDGTVSVGSVVVGYDKVGRQGDTGSSDLYVEQATGGRIVFRRQGLASDSCINASGEYEALTPGNGIFLRSPNGTRYRVTVSDTGALTVTAAA